jgi:hypothetical protein
MIRGFVVAILMRLPLGERGQHGKAHSHDLEATCPSMSSAAHQRRDRRQLVVCLLEKQQTMKLWRVLNIVSVVGFVVASTSGAVANSADAEYRPGRLLQSLLDGPLAEVDDIVFAMRISGDDHWYVNFGYDCNEPQRIGFRERGRLCRLNLLAKVLTLLLDDPKGGVRDPQVHYDGRKILFSYRKGATAAFHLYEINIDGTGLQQLTDGPDDDIKPTYLPDDSITFCSNRCQRVVNCWISRGRQLYRYPYGISNDRFLAANRDGIVVMDGAGNTELVYAPSQADGQMKCHEPRSLMARSREPAIPQRIDVNQDTGQMVLANIYHGRGMTEVERGEIKKLLVLEQLPKPVNFLGGQDPLSIGGTFTLARILGTVPVEPDGSAYMELPAMRSLFAAGPSLHRQLGYGRGAAFTERQAF